MKASDLIKALEDGKELEYGDNIFSNIAEIGRNGYTTELLNGDENFEIIEPKKKIRLHKYMYEYDGVDVDKRVVCKDGYWTNLTWDEFKEEIISEDYQGNIELLQVDYKEEEVTYECIKTKTNS